MKGETAVLTGCMSLSTDLLAKATPTRLMCRGGRWVLELSRLEAVDRDVYQPRLQRLEGAEQILALLRRSDEGQHLATGAAQLMRNQRGDEERAFEASDGDWVPSADAPGLDAPETRGVPEQELFSVIAELRSELVVLRASHARLRERVMALEAAQNGLPFGGTRPSLARGARARRRSEPPPAVSPQVPAPASLAENAGFAATQASPGISAPSAPQVPSAPPPVASSSGASAPAAPAAGVVSAPPAHSSAPAKELPRDLAELAAEALGPQLPTVLVCPPVAALNQCLSTLVEGAPALEATKRPIPVADLKHPQACRLLDDEGKDCGAIVLDLRAAVLLGAGLLALPREEAMRQVESNEPSEDALLAMSEICNNLTGPLNAVAGNRHVRATALAAVDVTSLAAPRGRADFGIDGGCLVFLFF